MNNWSDMTLQQPTQTERPNEGFSIIELLVAMSILGVIMAILFGLLSTVSSTFFTTEGKVRADERGRAVLELMTREVTPAVIDTRMQFAILPAEKLADRGALDIAPNSPAMLWLAPLGPAGELRCVGYYLTANEEERRYRIKRIYIKPDNTTYFPTLINFESVQDITSRTSPVNADWFLKTWDEAAFDDLTGNNPDNIVSTVAGGVVAMWIRPLDALQNPIPSLDASEIHPASDLFFNSASYFYMADGQYFDDGTSFRYLKENRLSLKANRLPTALDIAIVMLDDEEIDLGGAIPAQETILDETGTLDIDKSVSKYINTLNDAGFLKPRLFKTNVTLSNGG